MRVGPVLTNPQLEVVEGVLVDLLDALVQGDGEVCQRTQVTPFIFTLLWEAERKRRVRTESGFVRVSVLTCEFQRNI